MTSALPEVLEKLEPKDIQVSAYPEPVPGGMHAGIPKGVKVTHVPTGITVTCDHERSQHKNRDACLVAIAAALHGPALLASQQYAEANPLGGPASMLETAARRIRAGEDFHEVLADYDLHSGAALLRDAGDGWQTMREAPFGVDVLVITAGGYQQVAMQCDISHWADRNGHYVRPLMWRPLPQPPAMHAPGGG